MCKVVYPIPIYDDEKYSCDDVVEENEVFQVVYALCPHVVVYEGNYDACCDFIGSHEKEHGRCSRSCFCGINQECDYALGRIPWPHNKKIER